jgi:hypothetical protein
VSKDLRTTIIVDYQNVHLTGHGLFGSTRALPLHETLVDPLLFGQHGQAPGSGVTLRDR